MISDSRLKDESRIGLASPTLFAMNTTVAVILCHDLWLSHKNHSMAVRDLGRQHYRCTAVAWDTHAEMYAHWLMLCSMHVIDSVRRECLGW